MSQHKIIAKAWSDPEYKAPLLSDPKSVIAEYGIDLPDEDLEMLAGGKKGSSGDFDPNVVLAGQMASMI